MGAANSTQQSISTYNKLTNSIKINSTSQFVNNAVMESMKKSIISLNQNCSQKFESNAVIQLSNLTSLGNVSITDLNLDSNNVVKFDCIVQSQVLSQTENNFMSDNSSTIASMLQAMGTSDFLQSISGTLKSSVDSMPLTYQSTGANQSSTNIIDTQTSQNIVQNIQNLYKSTSVDDTTIQNVNSTYQGFVNNAKIIVNNVTAAGNIQVSAIRLDTMNQLDATAKLAGAITQVVLQKMQSILGMKIEFQTDTSQSSSTSNNSSTNTSGSTSSASAFNTLNNTVNKLTGIIGDPIKIVVIGGVAIAAVIILFIVYKLFKSQKIKSLNRGGHGRNTIDAILNSGLQFTENDTLSLIRSISI